MEAIIRADYECSDCDVQGGRKGDVQLHVHHIERVNSGGKNTLENLEVLCASCHHKRHRKERQNRMANKNIINVDTSNAAKEPDKKVPAEQLSIQDSQYICPSCEQEFQTVNHLKPHAKTKHNILIVD